MGVLETLLALPLAVQLFLFLAVAILVLIAMYPDRAYGTRARTDVAPSKTAVPVIGDMLYLGKVQPWRLEDMLRRTKEVGEGKPWRTTLWHPTLGPLDMINVSDPQDVETVLRDPYVFVKGELFATTLGDFLGKGIFCQDGAVWHAQRKTASHVFNVKNFRSFADDFIHEVDALCDHLMSASKANAVVDIQDLLLRATLDSFGRLAMGQDFGCIAQKPVIENGRYSLPDVPFMESFDYVNMVVSKRLNNPLWTLTERLDGTTAKVKEAQRVMFGFADKVIATKREKMAKGETIDENGVSSEDKRQADMLDYFARTKNFNGDVPSDEELRDVIMNIIIAGRDTTAQTLTWVFYCLATHPEVEKKAREELLSVLGKDGKPTYESLKDLKYVNAVFNECLRLYANVPGNILTCTKDTVLGGTGVTVRAGDRVQYSPWVMGRMQNIWGPDAEEFKPERWLDEKGSLKKENQYKWPVFKAGPRICLGMNMATQEAMTFMAQILRRFHLELVNEDKPEKWGRWDADPAKREGRYGFALTLCARDTVDFKIHAL